METLTGIPLGRLNETIKTLKQPELWGMKTGSGMNFDYTLKKWPSRSALLTTISMQEKGSYKNTNWKLVVKQGA